MWYNDRMESWCCLQLIVLCNVQQSCKPYVSFYSLWKGWNTENVSTKHEKYKKDAPKQVYLQITAHETNNNKKQCLKNLNCCKILIKARLREPSINNYRTINYFYCLIGHWLTLAKHNVKLNLNLHIK